MVPITHNVTSDMVKPAHAANWRCVLLSKSSLPNSVKPLKYTSAAFASAHHFKVHSSQQSCNFVSIGRGICRGKSRFQSPPKRPRFVANASYPATTIVQQLLRNEAFLRFVQGSSLNVSLSFLLRLRNQKVLTETGLRHATGLGIILWTTLGFGGYVLGVSFLVVGSALTRVGRARKEALGIAEKRGGARGPENLWGAAGVAALCAISSALCGTLLKQYTMGTGSISKLLLVAEHCLKVGFCSAIAAKSADTSSSEVGKAYGTRTFLITNFQEVARGTEGGVSVEGTVAGFFAALFTAYLAYAVGLIHNGGDVLVVTLAGNFANLLESVIGAALQSQQGFTNEQVNLLNTMIGAIFGGLLSFLLLS